MATIFNINDKHLRNVKALMKQKDTVIVHGDGHMFASNKDEKFSYVDDKGEVVEVTAAEHGSLVHRTFHAGYDDREAVARAGFRAVYSKGDKEPETVKDITDAFMRQATNDITDKMNIKQSDPSKVFKFEDEPTKKVEFKKPETSGTK